MQGTRSNCRCLEAAITGGEKTFIPSLREATHRPGRDNRIDANIPRQLKGGAADLRARGQLGKIATPETWAKEGYLLRHYRGRGCFLPEGTSIPCRGGGDSGSRQTPVSKGIAPYLFRGESGRDVAMMENSKRGGKDEVLWRIQ